MKLKSLILVGIVFSVCFVAMAGICRTCRGTGNIMCYACHGKGQVRTLVYDAYGVPFPTIRQCNRCCGYGSIHCPSCAGSGYLPDFNDVRSPYAVR